MKSVWNFSAGPAVLPVPVLEQVRDELCDWHKTGMSIIEISHRSKDYSDVAAQAEADLRDLLSIPENYKVLFLHGGAHTQFAMIPINLLGKNGCADYLITGSWSKKAVVEAQRFGQINIASDTGVDSAAGRKYTSIPNANEINLSPDAAYIHLCTNETIQGIEWLDFPERLTQPGQILVADMSSHILSRPINISQYGLIYAGSQKNIGPAGVTVVIIREDLIGHAMPEMPVMLDYKIHADNQSMYNTPCTFALYVSGLVFKWLKEQGGLEAMEEKNKAKADLLYQAIDMSGFYINQVKPDARSRMNIPFFLKLPELDALFVDEAKKKGIAYIKGHKSAGGMRASIYNAMPVEGVSALIDFMQDFERVHG